MDRQVYFNVNERKGNLHINVGGYFTSETAAELIALISNTYRGRGNIFIHTDKITEIAPQSNLMFANILATVDLPKENIYLTGEKGFEICHGRGKVIVSAKKAGHVCCGRCKDCSCNSGKIH